MRYVRSEISPKKSPKTKSWSTKTNNKQKRPFNRHLQSAVYSVYNFMKREKIHGGPIILLSLVSERVQAALKISKNTVTKYVKIGKDGGEFSTPGKIRACQAEIRDVNDDVKSDMSDIVYEFCRERRSDFEIVLSSVPIQVWKSIFPSPNDLKSDYCIHTTIYVDA